MTRAKATNAERWKRESEAREGGPAGPNERRNGSQVPRFTMQEMLRFASDAWDQVFDAGEQIPGANTRSADEASKPSIDLSTLQSPAGVHLNMLRGTIATPSREQMEHLLGVDPRIAELERMLHGVRHE